VHGMCKGQMANKTLTRTPGNTLLEKGDITYLNLTPRVSKVKGFH